MDVINKLTRLCLMMAMLMTTGATQAQDDVSRLIAALLSETPLEEDLQELCDDIGGRVTGTMANEKAVDWALAKLKSAGASAYKDSFVMPSYWHENKTSISIVGTDLNPLAVAKFRSPPGIHSGPLLHVGSGTATEMDQYSAEQLQEAFIIVETDLCLDINGLFAEYGHAMRVEGLARQRLVKGIIFMSSRPNKLLYRFLTSAAMDNDLPQITMAREDAKRIMRLLAHGKNLDIIVEIDATVGDEFTSHNVIAEWKGSTWPDEVITIGSHIDSWSLGTGANDNGCNVSLMIDIARQLSLLGIQPKRTLRIALWNGEEQGYYGSWDYTKDHQEKLDDHLMALSIDIGSGALTGFFTNGRTDLIPLVDKVLQPVAGLGNFTQVDAPIVGTDNFDFMLQGVPNLVGSHLPQVYGLNYHASSDTYDKVDLRQLKANSAIVGARALGFANLSADDAATLKRHNRAEIQQMIEDFNLEFSMRMFNVWEPWINGSRGRKLTD